MCFFIWNRCACWVSPLCGVCGLYWIIFSLSFKWPLVSPRPESLAQLISAKVTSFHMLVLIFNAVVYKTQVFLQCLTRMDVRKIRPHYSYASFANNCSQRFKRCQLSFIRQGSNKGILFLLAPYLYGLPSFLFCKLCDYMGQDLHILCYYYLFRQ